MDTGDQEWVETVALPGRTIVAAQVLTGGYSNHNTLLTIDDGNRYVLRRYLGTNACATEAALAHRLADVVPVPAVIAADDRGIMLSRFVPGRPVNQILSEVDQTAAAELDRPTGAGPGRSAAAELGRSVGETLARISRVTFDAPGFFGDGRLIPGPPGAEPTSGLNLFVERCLREGNAAGHLTDAEQKALQAWADEATPELAVVAGSRRLVHGDYNPKNLLAEQRDGRWVVTAALDWEYAFSSTPLFDIGNMLRDPRPGFEEAFLGGFEDEGGELPDNWRRLSLALDLYSLADFLTRPVEHRYFGRALERIRSLLAAA
jgi:aminoglycoside phosphotransferase (APT) family kinase protein